MLIYPRVAFSSLRTINGDRAIQESRELTSKMIAYVSLVMSADLKVPPIELQKARQATEPQQVAAPTPADNGKETSAPIVLDFVFGLAALVQDGRLMCRKSVTGARYQESRTNSYGREIVFLSFKGLTFGGISTA